ncbi:MAG: YkuS family protein [Christensenellales bacterium]
MIIAYQKGLEKVANELQNKGFSIVPWEKAAYADALIYHYAQGEESLLNSSLYASTAPMEGMLFVNINGLAMQQIVDILKKRRYSPLFE